ncbi:MAG: aldose epimerase [Gemmiger sp.]|nr:aldose epimerase [Gemmiger sp.]
MNKIATQLITEGPVCYEQYTITDPEAGTQLTITPERGGMITGFTLNGEEFIWRRYPNFSDSNRPRFGVPVLFPNCGMPDGGVHTFGGKPYPMEVHGLADLSAWAVESVGPDGVCLTLSASPLTKFLYPFDFTLLLTYNLQGTTATINLVVINEGEEPMPFSFGYHPYFCVSALENVKFDIHCATCSSNPKGVQPTAPATITLAKEPGADSSLRLLTGVDFPLAFTDSGNGHKVTVDADGSFTNGVLWQQNAEQFVCMEPWNGWANSLNEDGKHELLAPGEAMESSWSIQIEKA